MHIAVGEESLESLKLLLESNADPSIKNKEQQTPLDMASDTFRTAIRSLLNNK